MGAWRHRRLVAERLDHCLGWAYNPRHRGSASMVIAALIAFAALLIAWLFAGESRAAVDATPSLEAEPLPQAA